MGDYTTGYNTFFEEMPWDKLNVTAIKLFEEAIREANNFGANRHRIDEGKIRFMHFMPGIDRIIFNNPATIVYWTDGTKTVVKAHGEEFSEEHGLAMAFARKVLETAYGNKTPRAGFKRLVREATRY